MRKRLAALTLVAAFFCAGISFAAGISFPPPTGRVVDQVGLLTPAANQKLTQALAQHEAATGEQVVVAIVSSLQGQTVEDYGYQLGRAWGIGQKGKNNGAILLVAPSEHKVRIEVGYGLEGTLTDAKCSDIINDIILPDFKKGQMQEGVVAGAQAVLGVLGGQDISAPLQAGTEARQTSAVYGLGGNLAIIVIILMLSFMIRRGSFGWLPAGIIMNSWGTGSSGGFSGGGFSGGGGSFGGGGASGSW